MNQKVKAARVSVASNVLLVVLKLAVGAAVGSVSVMSEAIHSAVDLLAAVIALLSVRVSNRPADGDHAYGHGKVENLSALVEGALILVAAGWIIIEAAKKLRSGEGALMLAPGMAVMALSAGVNWLVSAYLFRVAREQESMALAADALHLRTDVWTSLGVLGGLALVQVTGLRWLDPVVAIGVALFIARAGFDMCREALQPLVDARLPVEEEAEIMRLIERYRSWYVDIHDLRTRRSGSVRHVDFHLVVPGDRPLEEVHQLCDLIEGAIHERYPSSHVLIHPEPLA